MNNKCRRALAAQRSAKPSLRHYYRLQPHLRWPMQWLAHWRSRQQFKAWVRHG